MAINVVSGGYVAAPRMRAMSAGQALPNLMRATIHRPNRYHAATFEGTFALAVPGDFGDAAWWSQLGPTDATSSADNPPPGGQEVLVDLQIALRPPGGDEGMAGAQWQSLLTAAIDDYDIDLADRTVHVSGRDLTARFVDAKTTQAFPNQTSSQIATAIAAGHGMQTNITATTTPVSRYYQDEHDKVTLGQFHRTTSEWDLLTFLAQNELDANGKPFDVRVDGTTLYFGPGPDPNSDPWVARWDEDAEGTSSNLLNLRLHRSLTNAKDLVVKVISWHSQKGAQIAATAKRAGGGKGAATPQTIILRRPNLTQDQAQKLAESTLHDMSLHERVIDFSAPGDLKLTPRVMVQLTGTGTTFDQLYYPDEITHDYDDQQGLVMHGRAKNASPVSQTAA